MRISKIILATVLASATAAGAAAQNMPAPLAPVTIMAPIVTERHGVFNGKIVGYRAFVEPFDTTNSDGTPAARLATISYVARQADPKRPILFVFNGGPIAPSAILHMGAFGPKRVAVPDDVTAPPTAFELVDNPYTVLDVADIVFFDPAGTGLSRFAPGTDPKSQFSIHADARQLVQLVLAWTKAHGRSGAPVYLLGESYGTLRAPEAAAQLAAAGAAPAGVILLGQAVNIVEYSQRRLNIVSYAVSLPTLAAIAWWHQKADRKGRDFDAFIKDAQAFGGGAYLSALFAGDTATVQQREAVATRLQEFTGIGADYWRSHALRMTKVEYQRLLFPGKLLATNDARYIGPPEGENPFDRIPTTYETVFARYLASDLRAGMLGVYSNVSPAPATFAGWDWGPGTSPFGDWPYGQAISDLMATQPGFRVFVANGYYDTQTTIGAMDYLVSQSGWPRDRVRTAYYQGGHMAYTNEASLKRFTDDVRAMITRKW